MAQRRMFSAEIVGSEEFKTMPMSSQALYFHLGMYADDDGFVQPKLIMRAIGFTDDDLKVLLAKRFLLEFGNGVVVIKHWLIHNMIRADRYKPTRYLDEKKTLFIKENKAYTDKKPFGLHSGNQMAPQVRLGKVRLGKNKNTAPPEGDIVENILNEKVTTLKDFQYLGLEIFEKTGAPINKKGECMRLAKLYPHLINKSLSFCLDYPNPSLKWKMFVWKLNELRKNVQPDQQNNK